MVSKKGFTLVELSIALVIIGLLIGGILAARSMIETAKLTKVMREVQQYDVAVGNFQTKYNQLPGDSNLLTPAGNNNGVIRDCQFGNDDISFCEEVSYFWYHLSITELTQGPKYSYTSSLGVVPGVNVPKIDIGPKNAGIWPGSPAYKGPGSRAPQIVDQPVYWLTGLPQQSLTANECGGDCTTIFTPAQAAAIDSKIDDGLPTTGNVTSTSQYQFFPAGAGCNSSTNYNLGNNAPDCSIVIIMLSGIKH